MISHTHTLDRKIKESNIEEIYERLFISTTDQSFAEVLAELGAEIANNPLFKSYIRNIGEKEKAYRKTPDIDSVIKQASFNPQSKQKSNQEWLIRKERKSKYFSLWIILRFNELYDISLHDRIRNELKESGNSKNLADFEEEVTVISNILEDNSNVNLRDHYLAHVHRTLSGIIQFLSEQKSILGQDQNIHEKILPHSKNKQQQAHQEQLTQANLMNFFRVPKLR